MNNYNEYSEAFAAYSKASFADPKNAKAYEQIISALEEAAGWNGRVFIAGMGGSAANAQHMANDLRKMCQIDAYSLTDNVAEMTARINDDGWASFMSDSLKVSKFGNFDVLFILSVSGGSPRKAASLPLVHAMNLALETPAATCVGIVGMEDSYAAQNFRRTTIVTPTVEQYQTQFAEAMQGVIWHGIISDPRVMKRKAKW